MYKKLVLLIMTLAAVLTMNVMPAEASTADDVAAISKQYIGVPYRFGGTTPSGFDCSGYVRYVYNKVGVSLPRTAAQQYGVGTPVSRSALTTGDLVFFQTYKKGPSHTGIYLGDNKFISATTSSGIKIDSLSNSYWGPKYIGAKRVLPTEAPVVQPPAPPSIYNDVPTSFWAYDAIKFLNDKNIVKGNGDGSFNPEGSITREQAALMVSRALTLPEPIQAASATDVSNPESLNAIAKVQEAGIMSSNEDGTFRPTETLTRSEMAMIISRSFHLVEKGIDYNLEPFADVPADSPAYQDIMALKQQKITLGTGDNLFEPNSSITRAEFATFVYRAMN